MKQFLKSALLLAFVLFISSCNISDKKKKADTNEARVVHKEQTYTMDTPEVLIKWTAYKFTDKLGVGGTFDHATLNLENQTGSSKLRNSRSRLIPTSPNL